MLHEQPDVLAALPQGSERDVEDVEAEVEILAEPSRLDLLLQVAVGGADHPYVDRDLALAAEPAQPFLLEDAEELGLQLDGNLADLVEEERAAVRQLPGAEPALIGAGEGASLVAEHLALHQPGGNGRAVDGDERLVLARRKLVDGPRHHLLAGPALAGDDHARLGRRDLLDEVHHLAHRRRGADDPDAGRVDLAEAAPQDVHLVLGPLLLQRALEDDLETGGVERLLDEVEDALAHRLHGRVDGSLAGDDDDRGVRRLLAQRARQGETVELGHHQIADDHVRVQLGSELERAVSVVGLVDVVAPSLEQFGEELAGRRLVVDDESSCFLCADVGHWEGGSC